MKGSLKRVIERFYEGNRTKYTDGDWSIAQGGYDCWFVIYVQSTPIIELIGNDLEANNDLGRKYLPQVKKILTQLGVKCNN